MAHYNQGTSKNLLLQERSKEQGNKLFWHLCIYDTWQQLIPVTVSPWQQGLYPSVQEISIKCLQPKGNRIGAYYWPQQHQRMMLYVTYSGLNSFFLITICHVFYEVSFVLCLLMNVGNQQELWF